MRGKIRALFCSSKKRIEKNHVTIEMEWAKLEMIAEFYQFPSTVFFLPKERWQEIRATDKTRMEALFKSHKVLTTIAALLKERGYVKEEKK